MTLTLITGPANAAKAGAVLDAFRAAAPREPFLVVPTFADVDHYQRELAAGGAVFGGEVVTFSRLIRAIAGQVGYTGRPLGRVARERVVRAAVADAGLEHLRASAASPGFADAAGRLFAELQRSLVAPERFAQAVRAWAQPPGPAPPPAGGASAGGQTDRPAGPASGRVAHAEEVARLYRAYRARLQSLGAADADGHAWAVLDALRSEPASWGGRPVLFYGFDDLTPTELDAVEALARVARADVTVALAYEPGREAFAGRAGTVEALKPLAERHVELPERSDHYTPGARPALHHLERRLFSIGAPRLTPNGAVRLLEAGGEQAEAELVGAEVLELMHGGVDPADIAVLFRDAGRAASLFERVLAGYGIPVAGERRAPLPETALGAGLLAFGRAGLAGGSAADVIDWLRTPGKLASPDAADALEVRVVRGAVQSAQGARRQWERGLGQRPLNELDELRAAARDGVAPVLDALWHELDAIWTAPHRRRAAVLGPEEQGDAQAAVAVRAAFAELRGLMASDPALVAEPSDVLDALRAIAVPLPAADPTGVLLADPLAIRARRFRAVFVCGLQDGAFPRRPPPEPFLDDGERRELAVASGLVLPLHEDALAAERHLFYACASRPEEVLLLSWRSSDEEGNPLQASPFVEDVRSLFTDELWTGRGRRLLADVTWEPREAPTPHELRRALAVADAGREAAGDAGPLAPPRAPEVLAGLAGRDVESARGLEAFAACGVRWLVEGLLRPARLEPDPDPMRRGSLAHAVLERTLRGLRDRTGSARLDPASLPAALEELSAALSELARPSGASPGAGRAAAAARALEVDLRRYLRLEAECGAGLEPAWLEWSFGGERDADPPLELPGRTRVSGRVDRVDVDRAGGAIVRDYKNREAPAGARWTADQRLQVALYTLAARAHLGLDPVAGVYQPLSGRDLRARGIVRDDGDGGPPGAWVATDRLDPAAFSGVLADAAETARDAAGDLRSGRIGACPERCTPRGCAYPSICRAAP